MRLTGPQKVLLAEIRETGGMYISRYGPYHRTVEALSHRGLVHITEHDYSRFGQDRWEPIEGLS